MKRILPTIVVAQFLCTSLWFAGNAVISDIAAIRHPGLGFLAHLTSAVQAGFITGTAIFALFTISDRFPPSRVFFTCALIAAMLNLLIIIEGMNTTGLMLARAFTGFFLAGIYPVGMKIAADYYEKGLGKSLGFLVGALVLGTAFPHLLKSMAAGLPWKYIVVVTSAAAVAGGTAMLLLVPPGPFRQQARQLNFTALFTGFRNKSFRAAAFGYFGHMWELYAFWAAVPVMLTMYSRRYPLAALHIPLLSFGIIASGGVACGLSGYLSRYYGAKRIATIALALSGLCCCLSPLFLLSRYPLALGLFLFFWGLVVVADSPLFSALVAQHAPPESKGTALTIVNCIGFSITIVSIQLINGLQEIISMQYTYTALAIGPLLGLFALLRTTNYNAANNG